MNLTEEQIKRGFWYYDPRREFPPECVTRLDEHKGGERLNIACTQLPVHASEQRAIVKQWCEALPNLTAVRYLWFSSRVSQEMFEAVSRMSALEGLYIKWSGIKTMASITSLTNLKAFHLGTSGSLENIDALSKMSDLLILELENLKKIRKLDPIATLTQLQGLKVEGSMETTQVVDTLAPLSQLTGLRYLFLANLKTRDKTLRPLTSLRALETLHTAWWYPDEEFRMLRDALPNLKHGNPVERRSDGI
jgi:hypothetical protein